MILQNPPRSKAAAPLQTDKQKILPANKGPPRCSINRAAAHSTHRAEPRPAPHLHTRPDEAAAPKEGGRPERSCQAATRTPPVNATGGPRDRVRHDGRHGRPPPPQNFVNQEWERLDAERHRPELRVSSSNRTGNISHRNRALGDRDAEWRRPRGAGQPLRERRAAPRAAQPAARPAGPAEPNRAEPSRAEPRERPLGRPPNTRNGT